MNRPSDLHPDNLRARAERCRTLAETFQDEWVKAKMLNLASSYGRMADAIESFEKKQCF
jgi:cytochrome c peroxidase